MRIRLIVVLIGAKKDDGVSQPGDDFLSSNP